MDNEFPGDHTDGVTPDPIPNSEAKPVRPMVVLWGESRYRQEFFRIASRVLRIARGFIKAKR